MFWWVMCLLRRMLFVAVCSCIAAVACDRREAVFGKAETRIRQEYGAVQDMAVSQTRHPARSCIDSVRAERWLVEAAAIAPPGFRREPKPQDADWYPVQLADIDRMTDGYVVLDAGAPSVIRFSLDFTERREWGRRGRGPGELQRPTALAVAPVGDTIWVLDAPPPRLVAFGPDGTYAREIRLRDGGHDLAIDGAGRFYVARDVVRMQFDIGGFDSVAVVSVYEQDGTPSGALVTVTRRDLEPPRFVLPVWNPVRVTASGTRVAVFYPVAGVVDVYAGRRKVATARVCMPRELEAAYRAQRRKRQSGWSVELITDVAIAPDGSVRVVGPRPDRHQRYHIDYFDATGEPLGSVVFSAKYIRLPNETRFGREPHTLVGFSIFSGVVAALEARAVPRPAN